MKSDLELAEAFVNANFQFKDDQRLVASGVESVPYFVLLRTRLGCIWRFRADLPREALRDLAKLAGREPALSASIELSPPPERQTPMGRVLEAQDLAVAITRDLLFASADARSNGNAEGQLHVRANNEEALEEILIQGPRPRVLSVPWSLRSRVNSEAYAPFADALFFSELQT